MSKIMKIKKIYKVNKLVDLKNQGFCKIMTYKKFQMNQKIYNEIFIPMMF